MTWSFSRLHAYEQCGYLFYLKYIEEREGESNYYAANGKAMHEVMEALLSGKISIEDCPQYYAEIYDTIYETTKQSTMDITHEKCMDYLCVMDDIDRDMYEILGVELRLDFKIQKYKFIGFADLVVRNKTTGEVILVDHKQANHFLKKDGTPLKNQTDNFLAYKKQMYIYCKGLYDCLGLKVDKIVWHHFKDLGELTIIPYRQEESDEALNWAVHLIEAIKKDNKFKNTSSFLMCTALCDFRNECEYNEGE